MKILHVIESLGRGGAEHILVSLLPALRERGHECHVAALWPPYDLAGELERRGVTVQRLDIGHRWQVLEAMRKLMPVLGDGFDVIHAHIFFAGFYCALGSFLVPESRLAVTFHNCGYDSYPADKLRKKVVKRVNGLLMRNRVDTLIAISPAVAESYRSHLSLGEIAIVPNSLDFEALDRAVCRDAGAAPGDGTPLVVVPGRLVPEKGHRHLLRAVKMLQAQGEKLRVVIVGDGPKREEIVREIGELGVGELVSLRPPLPHDELMNFVAASDLVVVPSTHEGFGMVALEAMALRRAVVATWAGGLANLVEDGVTGVLVPPADAPALSRAISALLADPELRERLGKAGRQRAEERFELKRTVALLERLYRGERPL